ncbi:MAG: hypothetical protein ACREEI_04150, partial [Stellaceae bacterium]
AGIAYGNLNTLDDFVRHPALATIDTATESGTVTLPLPPARHAAELAARAVPRLDEHGPRLRREFA